MWFNCQNRDVSLIGTVCPEKPPCTRRVVLQIRLENLHAILPAQVADFVRGEAVVPRVGTQEPKGLDQLFEEFLFHLVEQAQLLPRGKVIPKGFHFGLSHADLERHQSLRKGVRSIGAEALSRLSCATERSSILSVRAGIASSGTRACGCSR